MSVALSPPLATGLRDVFVTAIADDPIGIEPGDPAMIPNVVDLRVADLMTLDPVTVPIDAPIEEAEALLREFRISGLPVVDDHDHLVGVITQTDLLYLAQPTVRTLIRRRERGIRVGEVMSVPPVTVDATATLEAAARLMNDRRLHRVVVVDAADRPVGVLSSMDFVALAAEA